MTADQFNALDDLEQAQAVLKGIRIKTLVLGKYKFLLYNLDGLYIEVKYNNEKNIIESFTPFPEPFNLISYYNNQDISDLTDLL